jgi:ribosome-interacting GTPase 1
MPANLSPEYNAVAAEFRKARDPLERLRCLREMLRVIPKHKGTDHLQADLKRRIRELGEELEGPRRGGARSGPALVIHPEGAAQLALVGAPDSGKSYLHRRLTGSSAKVAAFPGTTQYPEPGMLRHEDVSFQLIDLPPLSPQHTVPWLSGTLQSADAALLVVDLSDPDCLDHVQLIQAQLIERRVSLVADWSSARHEAESISDGEPDVFGIRLPTVILANKADRLSDPVSDLDVFRDLEQPHFPVLLTSAETGLGLGEIGPWLFAKFGVVRVYTKAPGKPVERERPFTIRRGQTIADVARLVHRDLEHGLKYARLWGGSAQADGQHVGREHVLADGDIVELHT